MIFVIVPLGKAASQVVHWIVQVAIYVAASTVGGALVGLLLGAVGRGLYLVVPGPTRVWPVLIIGALALLYALHEARIVRLPQPERAWQVPNGWIRRWPFLGAAMFGVILGTGLFTFIPFTSFYVLLAWELGTGSLRIGLVLGAAYGFVRGFAAVAGGLLVLTGHHPLDFNVWLMEHVPAIHRLTSGVLLGVAAFLFAILFKT